MTDSTLETKVVAPTIVSLGVGGVIGALYGVARSFGWHFTSAEEVALAAVWIAGQPLLQFFVGYLAPHTHRPDLAAPVVPA